MNYELLYLQILFLTVAIEFIVIWILFRYVFKYNNKQINNFKLVVIGLLSVFTLPYVWFVFPALIKNHNLYILISEITIVLMEAVLIYAIANIKLSKALLISFVANLISFLIGLIL